MQHADIYNQNWVDMDVKCRRINKLAASKQDTDKTNYMTEILDETEKITISNINSRLSFLFSIITILLIALMFTTIPTWLRNSGKVHLIYNVSRACINISCLLGMIFTIRSFYKKENSLFLKWTGAILNTLMFIFTIYAIIYLTTKNT